MQKNMVIWGWRFSEDSPIFVASYRKDIEELRHFARSGSVTSPLYYDGRRWIVVR